MSGAQLGLTIHHDEEKGVVLSTALDISTLESHLWEAANILRGPVDAADFKTYIFPLLFFKRISDVYDEETQQALEESGGDEEYASFPEVHRFQIPPGCHWRDVRARTTNVGQALQNALRSIEKANPRTLYGIFGDAQWMNKECLSESTFDCVIANPPFSLKKWGRDLWTNDPYGRNFAGLSPKSSADYAWVQYMVESMAPRTGRMGVVLPHGVLFRIAAEGRIRRNILERDLLEVEGAARVVTLKEIAENDWNLNIPRCVEPVIEEETLTVSGAMENLKQTLNEAYAAEDRLETLLQDADLM